MGGVSSKVKYKTGHLAYYWPALEKGSGTHCETHGMGKVQWQWHEFCIMLCLRLRPWQRRHARKENRMW